MNQTYTDNCFWWFSQYCNGHHIDNYGETDQITVTGNKPRVGELDTAQQKLYI